MPTPRYTPLEEIIGLCESIYKRDGFVKWSEVADILGITRSAVQARLAKAVATSKLSQETYENWRSVSSRVAQSKKNKEIRLENDRCRITVVLTPRNKQWIQEQGALRQCTSSDIINGLLTREREENKQE